jgi:hypothetical protein
VGEVTAEMSGMIRDPKVASLIDAAWRSETLPKDDLEISPELLPDPEQDDDHKECTVDLEKRWNENNIQQILRYERK